MSTGITQEAGFLRKMTDESQEISGFAYYAKWGLIGLFAVVVMLGGYFAIKS